MRLQGRILTRQIQAPAFIRMSGLNTSRGWTMAKVSDPVETTLMPMSPCFASRPQIRNCSRSNPANRGRRIAAALQLIDDAVAFVIAGQENVRDISRQMEPFPPDYHRMRYRAELINAWEPRI